ncbi:unnamed protein product [Nippostrongylus brasiliensis]|uniref:Kelch-like protein 7 (inferred by orthology to a human protein) n=1 Tax=Nippostrongylus brasiliensis TaxID=27835 RepID=A0A0N4YGQ1_NIPBR|nr:unnamed protein product [Nippostrongylus brasiliensis]
MSPSECSFTQTPYPSTQSTHKAVSVLSQTKHLSECTIFIILPLSKLTFLIFIRNSWRAGPEMQYCRYGLGVTDLDGIIFAVGGEYESQTLREAEMLDPRQGEWISLPSMLNGRSDFGLVAVNDLLYAAGGNSGDQTLNSVEVYDPRACRWTAAQPMLKERYHAGVTVLRDQIVVVGGCDKNEMVLPSVEDTVTHTPEDQAIDFDPCSSIPPSWSGKLVAELCGKVKTLTWFSGCTPQVIVWAKYAFNTI